MTFLSGKTKINRVSDILLVAGLFCLAFLLSLRRMSDYDLWGHLKAGEYFFKTGSILTTHYFNCSWPEFPYLNHEWLFQAIVYSLYNIGGEALIVGLQVFLTMVSFAILYRTARMYSDNIPLIVFVLALGVLASSHRFALRPQHFSYVFLLINLFCLHQYTEGRMKYIYILPPVMLLWVNIHAESLWGIAVPGVFIIVEGILLFYSKKKNNHTSFPLTGNPSSERLRIPKHRAQASRSDKTSDHNYELPGNFKKLIMVYALIIAASLINPFSYKTVVWPLFVMSEQFAGVEELLPSTTLRYWSFWTFFGLFVISIMFSIKRVKIHFVIIAALFSISAWIANRGIPHFVFASAPVIVSALGGFSAALFRKKVRVVYFLRLLLLSLIAAAVFSIVTSKHYFRKFDNVPYPAGAVSFVKNQNIKGNMFNTHGWGGYLIWELYPQVRIYIDNRFFHKKFFDEYHAVLSGRPEWQSILDKYGINIVLLNYSSSDDRNIRDRLFNSSGWRLVYWDDHSLLYLKDSTVFKDVNNKYSMHVLNPDTGRFDVSQTDTVKLLIGYEEVRKNIENAKSSWMARFMIGNIQYLLDDKEESVKSYEEALRLSVRPVPAIYFNLAKAYMSVGKLTEAERVLKRLVEVLPDKQAYEMLWRISILQGRNKEAEKIYEKYLQDRR
ncbi:MAG: hypothetical protein A2X59_00455 [Nitrospirae bacterium GWC2_42_7]|nr:MAG: hypothetical protein A2X59_00455 [Nitrospirae bacterium GWC2_42_7]